MPKNSDSNFVFADHNDAARELIEAIPIETFRAQDMMVIAISDEGVVIANAIAQALEAPLDILLSASIPAPQNPELSIARVSETRTMVVNRALIDAFGIDEDYVYGEGERRYDDQVLSHVYRYRHGDPIASVEDRVVVLVDECVETGMTTLVAIKSMIERGAKNVYLAVPILDEALYADLVPVCDGIYTPHKIRDYISVEYYYANHEKTKFETIERILNHHE